MPTYEYKCPAGHLFEKTFPRIVSQRHEKCPVCGKRAERQISGGAGIVFKGSGFYHTDYKRAGQKQEKGETADKAGEKAEKAEQAGKSEKPAPTEVKPKPKKDSSSDK